jgi:nucleotide-binding universal stress UspA family protein
MQTFSRVLCPTDLSSASQPALRYAAAIAGWYSGTVHVLHVTAPGGLMDVGPSELAGIPHDEAPTVPTLEAAVAAAMGTIPHDVTVVAGDPAKTIVAQASAIGAELLVMGTHGRRGFDRFVHGSVTERVLGHAPCPVLTIPPDAARNAPARPLFQHIVCSMDFSPAAVSALNIALDLARQANGALTVMHAVEWYDEGGPHIREQFDVDRYRDELVADATTRLAALLAPVDRAWVDVRVRVTVGRPYRRILEEAVNTGADLIVIGAQGNAGFDLAVFGSTTRQVLREAACPVLVVAQP